MIKANPDYLPLFLIFIDYTEETKTEMYKSEILSFGGTPRLKIFTSTDYNEISNEILSFGILQDNEINAFRMRLRYTILNASIVGDKEES